MKGGGVLDQVSWKIKRAFFKSRKIKIRLFTFQEKGGHFSYELAQLMDVETSGNFIAPASFI